jgi:hypothetical protein
MLSVIFLLSRLCSDLALPAACMQQVSCTVKKSKPNLAYRKKVLIKSGYVHYESLSFVGFICKTHFVKTSDLWNLLNHLSTVWSHPMGNL